MKRVKSEKAAIGFGLTFVANLIMFILILGTGGYMMVKMDVGGSVAETAARNLGATIDSAMTSAGEVEILNECPKNKIFTIEGKLFSSIVARKTNGNSSHRKWS